MNRDLRVRRALPLLAGSVAGGALALEVLAVLLLREEPRGRAFPVWSLSALLYLLGNALENARRFVVSSPSTRGVMLAGAGQGWDYCYSCQSHVPPRCSHCFACNLCVLRRDHHCTVLGQCVGHRNFRYFLCMLLHSSFALLYGFLLNANVAVALLNEGTTLRTILMLVMPWLMLLMGQVSLPTFLYAFASDLCLVGFLFCAAFFFFHVLLSLRGQTAKEWFEGSRQYDLGWRDNLREVLGEHWHRVWLLPFVASPLPGDGITFRIKHPPSESVPKSRSL